MSRREVADAHGVHEATLRTDERDGLLPEFGTCPLEGYRAAVDLVKAARAGGLSPRRIRAALEASYNTQREREPMTTAYEEVREEAKELQRDHMARYGVVLPDVDALRTAMSRDPEREARYHREVANGSYDVDFLRRGLQATDERPVSRANAHAATGVVKTATMKLIDGMVDEIVAKSGGKTATHEARKQVWDMRPDLYEAYRAETTRNRGAGGESR